MLDSEETLDRNDGQIFPVEPIMPKMHKSSLPLKPITVPSARDAALGFYYQGLFALVVLFDALDGESVAIETGDDVALVGANPRLFQLKHSMGNPAPLSVHSDGIWKAIKIWSSYSNSDKHFVFVTPAELVEGDPLRTRVPQESGMSEDPNLLRRHFVLDESSINLLVVALEVEAQRVCDQRQTDQEKNIKLSFATRAPGCSAYLRLTSERRKDLVRRMLILPRSFNAKAVPSIIDSRLRSMITPSLRPMIIERLIERWDRRIALGLMGQRSRLIEKSELQAMICELVQEHGSGHLPNDFGSLDPESVDGELGTYMEKQIQLVDGQQSRVYRAARARWRARSQRERWMSDDISISTALQEYDNKLIEHWDDRYSPMRDDCADLSDEEQRQRGRELLDWAHKDAPHEVERFRENWTYHFLVQGTYQQLAEELRVGWHPRFRELLSANNSKIESEH